jgi:hypothetical protein
MGPLGKLWIVNRAAERFQAATERCLSTAR